MRVFKDEDGGLRNVGHSRLPMLRLASTRTLNRPKGYILCISAITRMRFT
jgi:hypothetical protein